LIVYICKTASFPSSIAFNLSTIQLAGNIHWTKTGTSPALIHVARVEPSNAIGIHTENVGATFETIADEMNGEKGYQQMNQKILETMNNKIGIKTKNVPCGMKSPRQLIANTKVIDATVITAVTKSNENEMGRDCPLPTNDAALDRIDSDFACQCQSQGRQDCPIDETGMYNNCYKVI
jgi:hypothetical protein